MARDQRKWSRPTVAGNPHRRHAIGSIRLVIYRQMVDGATTPEELLNDQADEWRMNHPVVNPLSFEAIVVAVAPSFTEAVRQAQALIEEHLEGDEQEQSS